MSTRSAWLHLDDATAPSIATSPAVGRSRPPISESRVVLPEPDRPRTATSSPRSTRRFTSRTAWTTSGPFVEVAGQTRRLDHRRPSVIGRRRSSRAFGRTLAGRRGRRDARGWSAVGTGRRAAGSGRSPASVAGLPSPAAGSRAVRPDADVVRLELQPDASLEAQRLDMRPRQLEPARPIEDRVLVADHVVVALAGDGPPAQRLAADAPVADGDRPADLLAHQRVVRHDDDRHAQLAVEPRAAARRSRARSPCRARRSARRRGAPPAGWRGRPRSPRAAARRPTGGPAGGRHDRPARPGASSSRAAARARVGRRRRRGPSAASTFSSAVRYGSRLRAVCCQTKPITRRR